MAIIINAVVVGDNVRVASQLAVSYLMAAKLSVGAAM